MAESEEELNSLLMRVKEVSEKAGLKLNIQRTKIMTSGSITSWQTDWGKVETVTDLIFLGSKITVGSDCSHEFKRALLLRRKAMTNADSILKNRDFALLRKILCKHQLRSEVVSIQAENTEKKLTDTGQGNNVFCYDIKSKGNTSKNRQMTSK